MWNGRGLMSDEPVTKELDMNVVSRRFVVPVVALALLVSCGTSVGPSPSPTVAALSSTAVPTPSAATAAPPASPTVAPTPTGTADPARYGLLLRSSGRISVRSEVAFGTSVYATGGERPAASHDGRKIAFWRTGPQGSDPQELRIAE